MGRIRQAGLFIDRRREARILFCAVGRAVALKRQRHHPISVFGSCKCCARQTSKKCFGTWRLSSVDGILPSKSALESITQRGARKADLQEMLTPGENRETKCCLHVATHTHACAHTHAHTHTSAFCSLLSLFRIFPIFKKCLPI